MACAGNHEKFREAETLKYRVKYQNINLGSCCGEGMCIKYLNVKLIFFSCRQKKLKFEQQETFLACLYKCVYRLSLHTDKCGR